MEEKNEFLSNNGFLSVRIEDLEIYPLSFIKQCSFQLQKMYKSHFASRKPKTTQFFELALVTKETALNLLDPYTVATLRGDKDEIRYAKSQISSISTIGYLPDGSPARLVIVEGAPGSGKTTFSFTAVLRWTENEILTDISLLALFLLRDYNQRMVTNLQELLALITPRWQSLIEELEADEGRGMAFWFDGWDEIASSLDNYSSVYEQLVSGELLPKARVIVTSRSWATNYIKTQLDKQPSQHIELVSSYQDQIDWLIQLKEKDLPFKFLSTIDGFLNYLESAPAIQGNMHTPLATNITLEVYLWSQESSFPLPTTVTQLYTTYTCLCIHKYLNSHSHFHAPKFWRTMQVSDLPEPLFSWFFSLCRLAFDGLLDGQRLVFPDVPNHLRLETLGLMQAQAPLYTSKKSAVVSYHYNHLTLQEFLSAQLLSWMSDEERSEIVEKIVNDGHFTMVLRFLNGLTKSSPIPRDYIRRMLADDSLVLDNLTIFHWLFERGDKAFTQDVFRKKEMKVCSQYYWSALDYFVTGHCIAQSKCSWAIDFSWSYLGDEKLTQFIQALSSTNEEQGNAYSTSINWSRSKLTSQSICHLEKISTHFLRYLKKFNLSNNSLDHIAVNHVANKISHMPQLEKLILDRNDIQNGGVVSLVTALCAQIFEESKFAQN